MSNYTKATNFATKDTLPTGDSNKIVKGTEIDNEFNSISGAISSKADIASPTFTGTPAAPTATAGSNTTQIATTAYVKGEIDSVSSSAAQTLTNKTIAFGSNTVTGTLSEFNTAVTDANLASLAGSETLTNKTIALGSNTVSGTKSQFNTAVTDTDFAFANDFTGSNQSLGTNGYQKLPGGLIMQWGSVYIGNISDNASATFSYPITFPSTVMHAYVTFFATDNSQDFSGWITSQGNSSCDVNIQEWSGSGQNITAKFFVIGY